MPSDPYKPTAIDRQHMAQSLMEQLSQHDGQWVAVRLQGTGWEIVRPRSQEAILAACDTGGSIAEQAVVIERWERVIVDTASHLAAAISLLERGGKAAKKAAPSDRMFDQMLKDYRASLERARTALQETADGK
jgi:hypothetical protein